MGRIVLLLFFLLTSATPPLFARDAFVLLSGGVSPMDNNYSQFLQARALASWFDRSYPSNSVWVFFGAGNVEGEPPIFCDVYHQVKHDKVTLDSWLAGPVRRNLPARHEIILRALRDEILPAVADGGTLFLFVGDHGSRRSNSSGAHESAIDLWSLERDTSSDRGWRENNDEELGVWELRRVLSKGLGKGRVVFCMTQCHSGGFHYLAIPHEMTPDPKWFTVVPDWAAPKEQPAFARTAGFTATDEFNVASGCNPDPNPDNWSGYERLIPESLLGINLLTSARTGKGVRSFAEAHVAAGLSDHTIDNPYSTSEQYLERWANLIDTKLSKAQNLTPNTKKALLQYRHTVDGSAPVANDAAFRERQTQFRRFTESLCRQDEDLRKTLTGGKRKELERLVGPMPADDVVQPLDTTNTAPGPRRRRGGSAEMRRLYNDTVRPAWRLAVETHSVPNLPEPVRAFEQHLLSKEDADHNFFFGGTETLKDEVFWQAGYSNPQTLDPTKAEAVALWGTERRSRILAWTKTSDDSAVRAAGERLAQRRPRRQQNAAATDSMDMGPEPLADDTAAGRVLFYRRVLAAWEFLLAMDERPALDRVRELTELERTPLPPPKP